METIILTGNSKKKIDLIAELAENLGMTVQRNISLDEMNEEKGIINAMKKGRTGEYVETKTFLEQLKQ